MTKPPYPVWCTLAERFEKRVREGRSRAEAAERLSAEYYANHFHVEPNLPNGCDFVLDEAGAFVVTVPGGLKYDPTKLMTRDPGLLDPYPIPLDRPYPLTSNAKLLEAALIVDLSPPAVPKVRGKHKSPDKAMAEATEIVASVAAYQEQHHCSQTAACEALYPKLGHNSGRALTTALYRARKRLNDQS